MSTRIAVWTSVAASLLALHAAPALALSGYASDQAAVSAQYPDAAGGTTPRGGGTATSLRSLTRARQAPGGDSPRARRARAKQRDIDRAAQQAAVRAVSAAVVLGPTETGSIALLLGGVGVLSVGGVLRWRRSGIQI